jgi:cell fate regulator YaaT (PSP1 superfamily)
MLIARVQFTPWDKTYYFNVGELELKNGDKVIVKTEIGTDVGQIIEIKEISDNEVEKILAQKKFVQTDDDTAEGEEVQQKKEIKLILRKAGRADLDKMPSKQEKQKTLDYCKKSIEKLGLSMKLVDVRFSFDASRLTFAFISDSRVDFRELAKDLTRHFGRTVRLQQIGIRDEARLKGDFGHCGRPLCCRKFLGELSSITSDMAEIQQCAHRGSDRISGICGRLMCCLSYEANSYKEMAMKFPPLGAKVNVDGKRGIVVGHHLLKNTVDVEFAGENGENRTVMEVDLGRHKK